jgi:hypothetical protein
MSTHRTVRKLLLAVGILPLVLASLTACANESKKSSSAPAAPAGQVADKATSGAAGAARVGGGSTAFDVSLVGAPNQTPAQTPGQSPDATGALPAAAPLGDALAITAAVTVEVPDVRKAVVALPSLVDAKGGAIYNTDIQVGDPKSAMATVTVKVAPADLERMISALADIGALVSRSQQTEDVSTQITDVSARILTAKASVERVRALLNDAKNLQDVTSIENELTNRETTLEQLLAQQRNLDARVQLATLTVTLTPKSAATAEADGTPKKPQTVGGAWHDGWTHFTKLVHGLGVAFAYAIPFVVLLGLLGLIAMIVRRRVNRMTGHNSPAVSEAGA